MSDDIDNDVTDQPTVSMGGTAIKRDDTPMTPGKKRLRIVAKHSSIKAGKDSGVPYFNLMLTAPGTSPDGKQPDKALFQMMFLGAEVGGMGYEPFRAADGVLGFCQALGFHDQSFPLKRVTQKKEKDGETELKEIPIINPAAFKKFVDEHDGEELTAVTKIRKGSKNKQTGETYADSAVVDFFCEAERKQDSEPAEEDDEGHDSGDGEDDVPEEKPAPKKTAAAKGGKKK